MRRATGEALPGVASGAGVAGATGAAVGSVGPAAGAPDADIRAMTCPTDTVSPSAKRISVIVPEAGAGSSMSTLSVEISTTVSPSLTGSPTLTDHSRIVPSVTDSPPVGVMMSIVSPRVAAVAASVAASVAAPASASAAVAGGDSADTGVAGAAVVPFTPPSTGETAPSPAAISTSRAPTETVSPSAAWILSTVPATGEGTSASTLSVEISTSVSSTATVSPSRLCHSRTVPSATESPMAGITTCTVLESTAICACQL